MNRNYRWKCYLSPVWLVAVYLLTIPMVNGQAPTDHPGKLLPVRQFTDRLGTAHTVYDQHFHGYRVLGGRQILHAPSNGKAFSTGKLVRSFEPVPEAVVSPSTAVAWARELLPARQYAPDAEVATPELIWVPPGLNYRLPAQLAYAVEVMAHQPHFRERLYLRATDGTLLAREDLIRRTDTPGVAFTTLSGERVITTELQDDGTYRLRQTGKNIWTRNLSGARSAVRATDLTDDDNRWEERNADRDEVATDVHWGTEQYHDLLKRMGRNSIDNAGAGLHGYVHYGRNLANAYWNGRAAFFGDGDTTTILDLPVVSIDVVGHEFTHGLIDHTAELLFEGEAGALNESFCDIFGFYTDHLARGTPLEDWRVARKATSSGSGIRSFATPSSFFQPDTYRGAFWRDTLAIHANSGVPSHWFYLLALGGTGTTDFGQAYRVEGVGVDTAFAIAYRTLTVYLTPASELADAASWSALAAADLYGSCSGVARSVREAWAAVGVGLPARELPGPHFIATGRHCSVPATVAFTNRSAGSVSYRWDFGDGSQSTDVSPAHTYSEAGTYTVTLLAETCAGTTDTLVATDYVRVGVPESSCDTTNFRTDTGVQVRNCEGVLAGAWGPESGEAGPVRATVELTIPHAEGIVLEFPEFELARGDAFLSLFRGAGPSATFVGGYSGASLAGQVLEFYGPSLTLTYSSTSDTAFGNFVCRYSATDAVRGPVADLLLSADTLLYGQVLSGRAGAGVFGTVTGYDPGDGSGLISDATFDHRYERSGTYTVRQFVAKCRGVDTVSREIVVLPPQLEVSPAVIDFGPLFLGERDTAWYHLRQDNGGELSLTVERAVDSFFAVLDTTIVLTPGVVDSFAVVARAGRLGVLRDTLFLRTPETVHPVALRFEGIRRAPEATFQLLSDSLCGNRIHLRNTSTDAESYRWNFGDGSGSTDPEPSHDYRVAGTYEVALTAIRDSLESFRTETVVTNGNPFLLRPTLPDSVTVGQPIRFTAESGVDSLQYLWRVPPDFSSGLATPDYTFTSPGTYAVIVEALAPTGCRSYAEGMITALLPTSVRRPQEELDYNLYPNPSSGIGRLEFSPPTGAGDLRFDLYDGAGRLIWRKRLPAGRRVSTLIGSSTLPGGTYRLLVFKGDRPFLTAPMIVRH